jgi:hypothetical protein
VTCNRSRFEGKLGGLGFRDEEKPEDADLVLMA